MVKRRRRFKQTTTLAQRLTEQASRLRDRARALAPGQEQSLLWRKVQQAETALRIEEWLSAPGAAPPADVMPASPPCACQFAAASSRGRSAVTLTGIDFAAGVLLFSS
jgi:hypothetical protein